MYECVNCGKRAVGWKADYDFENFGYEGKGTVHIYRCSNCNAEIECRVCAEEEKMSRYIAAENLYKIKYHNLPYTHIVPSNENAESYKRGWNDAIDAIIENEPTADVQPVVRGEWIEDGYNDEPCVCSNCGHPEPIKARFLYSYCPNCGADMRGGNNELHK